MMKRNLMTLAASLAASLPALSSELPPVIPVGPVTYDTVSYAPATAPATGYTPASATDAAYSPGASAASYTSAPEPQGSVAYAPMTPAPTAGENGYINLNVYSSQYQVRGMGVTDGMSSHGYSSISGSYTLPNRNLFGMGLQHRLSGTYGYIWDAREPLGDTPLFNINYALGKELFPNLLAELGYSLHHGGLEGFMARYPNHSAHRLSQDINLALTFNDHQKGFFGHALMGIGFQGLTGTFYDLEAGYRLTDILQAGAIGVDLELSAGVSASLGYWGSSVEGIDAWRIKAALPLFTHSGTMGRDARMQLKPWAQISWSGTNAKKIDRLTGYGPIDHFQLAVGLDLGWKF